MRGNRSELTAGRKSPRCHVNTPSVNRHYRLMKTCSVRSKRGDQYQSDNRETKDKTKPFNQFLFCNKDAFQSKGFSRLKCPLKRKKIDTACL